MVDIGKVCALFMAGWDKDLIADEMDISVEEVRDVINAHYMEYRDGKRNFEVRVGGLPDMPL